MKKAGVMSPWDLMNQNNNNKNNTVNGNNKQDPNNMQKLAEMGAAGNMMGIVNNGQQQQAAPNGKVTQPAAAPMGGTTPAGGVTQPAAAPTGGTVNGIQESKPQGAGGATQSPLSANTGAVKTADISAGLETATPTAPTAAGTGSVNDGPRQSQESSDAGVGSSAVQETDDEISVTLESPTYSDSGSSSSSGSIGSAGSSVGISGGSSGVDGISGGSGMTGGDLLPGKVTGASALFGSVSKFLNGA
ncbi:MAG: hypothetical protein AB2L14_13335 [Candidatus Xenobiia bacterium LiM19]